MNGRRARALGLVLAFAIAASCALGRVRATLADPAFDAAVSYTHLTLPTKRIV